MSGLVALLHPRGKPAEKPGVEAMTDALVHRGGDGRGIWSQGHVGLGHHLRRTTPGARPQPLVVEGEPIVVAADLRLDNRQELAEALGLGPDPPGDARLVALAWRAWGEDCARRLLGDFAFALWDGRRHLLYCARDYFGVKPLYYRTTPDLFLCASEIGGLLAHPEVTPQLDRVRLGDYLEFLSHDEGTTFFEGIRRLPPGHHLTVDGGGARLVRYHDLLDSAPVGEPPPDDWAEALGEALTESVRARLAVGEPMDSSQGAAPIGAFLSGGLDTSSIVCTARALLDGRPLHALSAVFDEVTACDERQYMAAVVEEGGIEHHLLHADQTSPLQDWARVSTFLEEPCYGASCYLNWGLYRLGERAGLGVVLDGWGGDGVVGYGFERLLELALGARLPTLARELTALGRRLDKGRRRLLRRMVLNPLGRALWRSGPGRWTQGRLSDTTSTAFAREMGLAHRVRAHSARHRPPPLTCRAMVRRELTSGTYSAGLELLDRSATPHRLEPRYPFFDRRVVELCLRIPSSERLRDGWTRAIQRRAMAPVLPAQIRERPWKTNLGPSFLRGLTHFEEGRLSDIVQGRYAPIEEFVDLPALGRVHARFLAQGGADDAIELAKIIGLALWLRGSVGGTRRV